MTEFRNFVKTKKDKKLSEEQLPVQTIVTEPSAEVDMVAIVAEENRLFKIVNPDTGRKFDIPMLTTDDPEYYFKYVELMKTRERSPETFAKILNWD